MIVMPANNSGQSVHRLARKFPGRVGWLNGPSSWKNPVEHIPYALDNDAFSAFTHGTPWDKDSWLRMLDKASKSEFRPRWCLIPDVVADRERTIENWNKYRNYAGSRGFVAAFAVQDGMTQRDVPSDADVVFVGGTTGWKWRTVGMWCQLFPRVHVGRVRQNKLRLCAEYGAESCDGTGWFREGQTGAPIRFLEAFLEDSRPYPSFSFYSNQELDGSDVKS